jgi:hypothetical protein
VPIPSQETIEHGDALAHAQLHKTLVLQDFWNKSRIFGAKFRRMFLRVRRLARSRFFSNYFDPAHVEFSAPMRAQQPTWFGIFFEQPCSQLKKP